MMNRPAPAKVRVRRFFRLVLPAAIILIVGVIAILAVLLYRITHPGAVPEAVNPSHFLLPSVDVTWPAGDGIEAAGWWIPGSKDGPGVLLVPGLGMCRSDALSLALPLHQDGFNLLICDSRGSGALPRGASSLGLREADDVLAALRFMMTQLGPGSQRLGIWGVDVGARAALHAAALVPEVGAIAADGAYDIVLDFVNVRFREESGIRSGILEYACRQVFRLMHLGSLSRLTRPLEVAPLSNRSILFIEGENRRDLGRLTEGIYLRVQPQKELATLKAARVHSMSGADLGDYDRQVATFFRLNLRRADKRI
jgi:hypothetical protein